MAFRSVFSSARARLVLFFVALFIAPGIHLPFWPVWLNARGITPGESGLILAVGVWSRVLANPIAGNLADLLGKRRMPLIWCAWISLLAVTQFLWAQSFWPILIFSLVYGLAWAPLGPLADNLTMTSAKISHFDYGRVRLWGSASFMVATVVAGIILTDRDPGLILPLLIGGTLLVAIASHWLPDVPVPAADRDQGTPVLQLLRQKHFLTFLIGGGALNAAHGAYYAIGSLAWRDVGLSSDVIGWLWAEGVLAEILLFYFGLTVLRRLPPLALMMTAAATGLIRWPLTILAGGDLSVLIPLQLLHAATFAAAHLGAMHYISRTVSPTLTATAQTLYATMANGLLLGASMLVSSWLYGYIGIYAYLAMTVLSITGGLAVLKVIRR